MSRLIFVFRRAAFQGLKVEMTPPNLGLQSKYALKSKAVKVKIKIRYLPFLKSAKISVANGHENSFIPSRDL